MTTITRRGRTPMKSVSPGTLAQFGAFVAQSVHCRHNELTASSGRPPSTRRRNLILTATPVSFSAGAIRLSISYLLVESSRRLAAFSFPIGLDMKRNLWAAVLAATLLSGAPAYAQTYQDSGGTYVRGIVPVQADESGPLFTISESRQNFRFVFGFIERLSANSGLCDALRWSDLEPSRPSEWDSCRRLQHGFERGLCDAWWLEASRRRHPMTWCPPAVGWPSLSALTLFWPR